MSIKTFAVSLISIFIPIYLYVLGYGLRGVFLFYFFEAIFKACGEYLSGSLVTRYGAKHILALSYPAMAISFIFLITLPVYNWPLWFLSITAAIPLSLFWIPYHDDFSKAKSKKGAGKEIGRLSILIAIFGALGPILGGALIQQSGIETTLVLTIFILIIALLPLMKTSEITKKRPLDMKNFSFGRNYKDMLAYGGYGLEISATFIIWPIFVFLLVGDYVKVGSITTIALLAMVAFSLFIGRMTDKYEKGKVLKATGILNFFGSFSKVFVTTVNTAYLASIISSITHILVYVPFVSEYYLHADQEPRIEYIIGMEIAMDLIRALGFVVLYSATYFMGIQEVLIVGLVMGALGSLLSTNIAAKDKKRKRYSGIKIIGV